MPIDDDSDISGVHVKFDNLTVANFKDILFNRKKVQGITAMNIWKPKSDLKYVSIAVDIGKLCMMMDTLSEFKEYYNQDDKQPKKTFLHIIIQPTGKCLPTFYLKQEICGNKISILV